jgi:hypothetical protein
MSATSDVGPALIPRLRLLTATLWVGSLWTVGYLAAPVLFITLHDRVLAGTIAGSLFRVEAWLSLVCGAAFIVLAQMMRSRGETAAKTPLYLALGMLLCTLVGYFGLQPFMAALREAAGPAGVMESGAKVQFGVLHGVSSAIYLIQSLLGAALILKIR